MVRRNLKSLGWIGVALLASACSNSGEQGGDIDNGTTDSSTGDQDSAGADVTFDPEAGGDSPITDTTTGDSVATESAVNTGPTGFDGAPPVDAAFPCDGCTPFP